MKTMSRLIRRYVAAAFCLVLLLLLINALVFAMLLIGYGLKNQDAVSTRISRFAQSFALGPDGGVAPGGGQTADEWMRNREWAMLLDDNGEILWKHRLPAALDRRYTVPEVASFSRWYLDDYPVFVYQNAFGLLVAGLPKGSLYRANFYLDMPLLEQMIAALPALLIVDGVLLLGMCLLLSLQAARGLRAVAQGIDDLARGEAIRLPERGLTGELAEKLNRTSRRLAEQSACIARRDGARTEWIAGVSHDIRTPLALILGHAEQLAADPALPEAQRGRAGVIAAQCAAIRALIEDLNLTSKLQYGAQPLRAGPVAVGALLRGCVTDFLNSGQAGRCDVRVEVPPEAGQALLHADAALLRRAIANLLGNSARHNPGGCAVAVGAALEGGRLTLAVRDGGAGYPAPVLRALNGGAADAGTPHILGLFLVAQIVRAHGGGVRFFNDGGACCAMTFDTRVREHV